MALYLPPKNSSNARFNVLDFASNAIDYTLFDERYVKLFGTNNILSINKFYGINTFFSNFNSFMYLTVLRVLSVANSIVSPLFISEKIQTMELQTKIINGIPYSPVGIWLNLNAIQFPIIKCIEDLTSTFGGLNLSNEINNNASVLIYPNYQIYFYADNKILLQKIDNISTEVIFQSIRFKYNLPCFKIIIAYKNKKII
jgi:hypothetical protein